MVVIFCLARRTSVSVAQWYDWEKNEGIVRLWARAPMSRSSPVCSGAKYHNLPSCLILSPLHPLPSVPFLEDQEGDEGEPVIVLTGVSLNHKLAPDCAWQFLTTRQLVYIITTSDHLWYANDCDDQYLVRYHLLWPPHLSTAGPTRSRKNRCYVQWLDLMFVFNIYI